MDDVWTLARLRAALHPPLPGNAAKARLAPQPDGGRLAQAIPATARPSAVLIALYPEAEDLGLPLLRRRRIDGDVHSGQIALPGGGLEGSESIEEAALREAEEEIGLCPQSVRLVGRLSPQWIPVSGYVVHPVVGWLPARPSTVPDPAEVDSILWARVDQLRHASLQRRPWRRGTHVLQAPGWELPEGFLWGATAMILAELLVALDRPRGA